jgi:DNA mismatch repair protein PMS2
MTNVFTTTGKGSIRENYAQLYGIRSIASLMDIAFDVFMEEDNVDMCGTVSGLISKVEEGCGRSTGDRQHIYLNGRPVDLPAVCDLCKNDQGR